MKFVLTADGLVNTETLQTINMAAKPLTWEQRLDPFYWAGVGLDTIGDAIAKGWDKFVNEYYEFISWSFTELTKLVTTVPTDLLTSENSFKMQAIFMGYSVLMMIFLTIAEGYKAIMGISYTKPATIFGRTFIALIGAGMTMPAVVWLIKCSNMAVQMIAVLADTYFHNSTDLGGMLRDFSASGTANFIASALFMIAFLYFICHALFKVGVRWFDLLMNMVSSPFAWASYVTNGTSKHLSNWMTGTGKLILINIVYAFYVTVISVIVMAPGPVESFGGWVARMLLLVGGLYRLANPPSWIQNMDAQGTLSPMLRKVYNMVTFRKLRTM
jgi:hypothetical protein